MAHTDNTRLIREDFTGYYLKANGGIYRPASAFAGRLDQMPIAVALSHLAGQPEAERHYPEVLTSLRHQVDLITAASRKPSKLRSRNRPTVTLLPGTPMALVGPRDELWLTGHPSDQS